MAKIDPKFAHDIFRFIHKPIRDADRLDGNNFLERFLKGPQIIFEQTQDKIKELRTIRDPATTRPELLQFLKDEVGFTKELRNITDALTTDNLRRVISLAVALWKSKGTEPGYKNVIFIFTGQAARVFNYFDFRWIIGETQFGENQVGDDPFLISRIGLLGSEDPINDVIALFKFENDVKDESPIANNQGLVHGLNDKVFFYPVPNSGFPNDSAYFVRFIGSVITIPHVGAYDFSSDLTFEFFFRSTSTVAGLKTIFNKTNFAGRGIKLEWNAATNLLRLTLSDGTTTIQEDHTSATTLNDGFVHHIAIAIDRTNDLARIFIDGTLSSSSIIINISTVGNISNTEQLVIGGSSVGLDVPEFDMDNFRICTNLVYDPSLVSDFPKPLGGFISYQEEILDEYVSDIRVVDDGNLDKITILRVLNLMRPRSERINVIFVDFYDNFENGIGQFFRATEVQPPTPGASVTEEGRMLIAENETYVTDVLNDETFKDIFLQVSARDGEDGSIFSVVFLYQDNDNYYEFRINTITQETSVHKTVAGIDTQISAVVVEDIVAGADYFYTVRTFYDTINSETLIECMVDGNRLHRFRDDSFSEGKFGFIAGDTGLYIKEVEMTQHPVDVQRIAPGFSL